MFVRVKKDGEILVLITHAEQVYTTISALHVKDKDGKTYDFKKIDFDSVEIT